MFLEQLKDLEKISQAVGNSPDLVQGGGGNTSVKLDDTKMAVKASGFKLKEITPNEGYVVVDYQKIRQYHQQADLSENRDFEKESGEFVRASVIPMEGLKPLRPSVEAGFHSILLKHVIHTHPVYSNMICCSKNGQELADSIFSVKEYGFVWIPYINPGFMLTLSMQQKISEYKQQTGKFPQVIFMENHGLVVTADTADAAISLHEDVIRTIRQYFHMDEPFPVIKIESAGDGAFKSKTQYLIDYFKGSDITLSFFENTALYPDQLVYLNGNIAVNGSGQKLNINTVNGEILYRTNEKEALTMEETLLGFVYVVESIRKYNLSIKTMSDKETDFIRNWESEKYRKSLLGNSAAKEN
ncbi:MAG: class II aldolase [Ruminiclostridium sp.]|nr:class II aldolase [Ruminiclostridium sp.]